MKYLETYNHINELEEEYSLYNNYYNKSIDTNTIEYKAFSALDELDIIEKRLFLLYCEYQSTAKLAQLLNVSKSTIQKKIKKIKTKMQLIIKNKKNKEYDNYIEFTNDSLY